MGRPPPSLRIDDAHPRDQRRGRALRSPPAKHAMGGATGRSSTSYSCRRTPARIWRDSRRRCARHLPSDREHDRPHRRGRTPRVPAAAPCPGVPDLPQRDRLQRPIRSRGASSARQPARPQGRADPRPAGQAAALPRALHAAATSRRPTPTRAPSSGPRARTLVRCAAQASIAFYASVSAPPTSASAKELSTQPIKMDWCRAPVGAAAQLGARNGVRNPVRCARAGPRGCRHGRAGSAAPRRRHPPDRPTPCRRPCPAVTAPQRWRRY